jgi:hypothetical protein
VNVSSRRSVKGSPEVSGQPDPVRELIEALLVDPLGFVASVPVRLAKGKAKIESQTKTANMIGKFVVPIAKRKIDTELKAAAESVRSYLTNTEPKRGTGARKPSELPTSTQSNESNGHVGSAAPSPRGQQTKPTKSIARAVATTHKSSPPLVEKPIKSGRVKAVDQSSSIPVTSASKSKVRTSRVGPVVLPVVAPRAVDTGLDGYDDLPASSIVSLLEALTAPQLRSIAAYESMHRNRQTILGGVARLLGSAQEQS